MNEVRFWLEGGGKKEQQTHLLQYVGHVLHDVGGIKPRVGPGVVPLLDGRLEPPVRRVLARSPNPLRPHMSGQEVDLRVLLVVGGVGVAQLVVVVGRGHRG